MMKRRDYGLRGGVTPDEVGLYKRLVRRRKGEARRAHKPSHILLK